MRMLDDKRTLKTIERALVEARMRVTLTKTWRDLHHQYGVGRLDGRMLALTASDRATLRELVKHHCNIDLLAGGGQTLQRIADAGRMELSQEIPNEKLSGAAVASDMVLIGSPMGTVPLPGRSVNIPPDMLIQCHYSHLHGLSRVVLVENLAVMYALNRYRWPEGLADAVMLFRGSPQMVPAAVTNALRGVDEVVCFPDFDPQGFLNSLTQPGCTGIVMPTWPAVRSLREKGLIKVATFDKQHKARQWLTDRVSAYAPAHTMLVERLAIAQEAMPDCDLVLVACP